MLIAHPNAAKTYIMYSRLITKIDYVIFKFNPVSSPQSWYARICLGPLQENVTDVHVLGRFYGHWFRELRSCRHRSTVAYDLFQERCRKLYKIYRQFDTKIASFNSKLYQIWLRIEQVGCHCGSQFCLFRDGKLGPYNVSVNKFAIIQLFCKRYIRIFRFKRDWHLAFF